MEEGEKKGGRNEGQKGKGGGLNKEKDGLA